MPEPGGGTGPPIFGRDQLILFQPGEGILSPPITTGPPKMILPSGITVKSIKCRKLNFALIITHKYQNNPIDLDQ